MKRIREWYKKWHNQHRWDTFSKELFRDITTTFLNNRYAIEFPDTVGIHMKVSKNGRETHLRFVYGGLLGAGLTSAIAELADKKILNIVVVTTQPLNVLELRVLNNAKVRVITAPTPEELFYFVHRREI